MNYNPFDIDLQWFADEAGGTGEGGAGSFAGSQDKDKRQPVHPYAAQLAGERKYDEELKEVQSLNDLYDQWKEYKKKAAGLENAIVKPGENASEEEWKEYYKKIGVPEKYELKEELPTKDLILKMAEELKMTEEQFNKLVEYEKKRSEYEQTQLLARAKEQTAEVESFFREKWGTHFAENIGYMNKGITVLGGDALKKALQKLRNGDIIGNDPVIVEALVKAGKLFSEDRLVVGTGAEEKPKPAYPSMTSMQE